MLVLAIITSSAMAVSWTRKTHTAVKSCENKDFLQVKTRSGIEQRQFRGDIGQQAMVPGFVKGKDMIGRPFQYDDKCVGGKVLEEGVCASGAGTHIGNFVQIYRVSCTHSCNAADATHFSAWCS